MRAMSAVLLLHSLASLAGASRIRQHESAALQQEASSKSAWLKKAERWCTSSEASLSCDEKSIIDVYSAFYARAWRNKCELRAGSGKESCDKNATDQVLQLCQGLRQCSVPASVHPSCADDPHYSVRIVWDCVEGDPPTAKVDVERKDVALDGLDTDVAPTGAPRIDAPPGTSGAPGALHAEVGESDEDGTATKALKAVEAEAEKVVKQPGVEVSFNPCYRRTRMSLLWNMQFFARLTTCPSQEGCFKLTWEDGRTYEDPMEAPDRQAILQAKLAHGSNGEWMQFWRPTWFGIGLQRNDYDTWGVCLPKTEGVNLAVAVFNSMKEH